MHWPSSKLCYSLRLVKSGEKTIMKQAGLDKHMNTVPYVFELKMQESLNVLKSIRIAFVESRQRTGLLRRPRMRFLRGRNMTSSCQTFQKNLHPVQGEPHLACVSSRFLKIGGNVPVGQFTQWPRCDCLYCKHYLAQRAR